MGNAMQPLVVLISVFAIFIPALMLPGPDFIAVGGRILLDSRNPLSP